MSQLGVMSGKRAATSTPKAPTLFDSLQVVCKQLGEIISRTDSVCARAGYRRQQNQPDGLAKEPESTMETIMVETSQRVAQLVEICERLERIA